MCSGQTRMDKPNGGESATKGQMDAPHMANSSHTL